ncbi:MAG: cell division protein ZapE, partial [Candidatus Puniceispirillaceae bacterium]
MPLSPDQHYQRQLDQKKLSADAGQKEAVGHLSALFSALQQTQTLAAPAGITGKSGLVGRLFGRKGARPAASPKGVYLYGGVGRGKTMLMDLFACSVPSESCQRFHFHDFMVAAQDAIQRARLDGAKDPIDTAADRLIAPGHIICFDEMEVRDIADAMIIKRLFDGLWARGMILVATSNRMPDELYLNGLHRDRFLPFIEALKQQMNVHHIGDGVDWRGRILQTISSWYVPGDEASLSQKQTLKKELDALFLRLSDGQMPVSENIMVAGRSISFDKVAGDLADVSFDRLCRTTLGARD